MAQFSCEQNHFLSTASSPADSSSGSAGVTVDVLPVVEVSSPSTRVSDRQLKSALYAAAGIPYSWRVDLEPAPRVTAGELRCGAYIDQPSVPAGAIVRVEQPFPLAFDPAALARR